MSEFRLIDAIVQELGDDASGGCLAVGPGDDASVSNVPAGTQLVSSIDTLLVGRHFPEDAAPRDVGYRSMMVALSDLAAMGAEPHIALIALTAPSADEAWMRELATGIAAAARVTNVKVAGGNLCRGTLSLSVSVHGLVPEGQAVTRSGAAAGDTLYVTGALGGAAAALDAAFENAALNTRYYQPRARVDLAAQLRACASAAIDLSDGLLQDVGHLAAASGLAAQIESKDIPVGDGAKRSHVLGGSDDYELCFAASVTPPFPAIAIGRMAAGEGVWLDGEKVAEHGYQHFA